MDQYHCGTRAAVSKVTLLLALAGGCGLDGEARAQTTPRVEFSGDVSPSPILSPVWDVGGSLYVGDSTAGTLTITNGGIVTDFVGYVGYDYRSKGAVTVSGRGSQWINSAGLSIGYRGLGSLRIENGDLVKSDHGVIGDRPHKAYTAADEAWYGNGAVTVSGTDSQWINAHSHIIGAQGAGKLTIQNGGKVVASYVSIAPLGGRRLANSIWSSTLLLNGDDTNGRGVLETRYVTTGTAGLLMRVAIDGGILRAMDDEADFLRGFTSTNGNYPLTIERGGAFIDTNGHNVGVHANLEGPGGLTKLGAGTLTLWNRRSYTGGTTVEAGELKVNGSLLSTVTVASGATLSGDGTVGGVMAQSGAIISPGNSIGTLQVSGNVTFGHGSVYQVEIDGSGHSDRIAATGTASLNGGTVSILPDQGRYSLSPYTILTAKQGVTGRFTDTKVEHQFAFLNPVLDYGPDAVTLTLLLRKGEPSENDKGGGGPIFNSVAATRNQFRVADAVERLGFGNGLFDTVLGASAEGARQAFDVLSGEAHASAVTVAYGDAQLVHNAILNRLRQPMGSRPILAQSEYAAAYAADRPGGSSQTVAMAPAFDPRRFAVWGEGFGAWGQGGANGNAAGLKTSTGGFVLGAETTIDEAYRIGIAGGFTTTSFDVDGRLSSGTNDSIFGSVYGAAKWDAINVRLGTAFASRDMDVGRTISFPGFFDQANASSKGSTLMAFGEVGYELALGGVTVEPFVGASMMRLHTDGFHEEGGSAALIGYGHTSELGTTTFGLRAEARLSDDLPLTLRGMAGWRHAFGDVEPTALLAFSGGASAFTVAGIPIDRDALVAEVGLDRQITDTMMLGVAYSGQIGSRAQEHALKGNFTWQF